MGRPYEVRCWSDTQLHHTLITVLNSACIKRNFILCVYFVQFLQLRSANVHITNLQVLLILSVMPASWIFTREPLSLIVWHEWRLRSLMICTAHQIWYWWSNQEDWDWRRGEVHRGLWWGSLREGDHLEDPGVDVRVILKWIFKKWYGGHGMD
jgi:hypothetical protein